MQRNRYVVGLVLGTFFVISLLTNILGAIIPDMISGFSLSLSLAACLPLFAVGGWRPGHHPRQRR